MAPPLAPQATAPTLASQAMAPEHVGAATFSPPVLNADGTISCRMDQVSINVVVTFSGNEEMASKKSKLFGSSAKFVGFLFLSFVLLALNPNLYVATQIWNVP